MTEKTIIIAPGTWTGPLTTSKMLSGRAKHIYSVETEEAFYKANSLTVAMNLWRNSKDNSAVLDVGRV